MTKISTRNSFKFWMDIRAWIENKRSTKDILEKIHSIIDRYSGFKSQKNSDFSFESLEFLFTDEGEKLYREFYKNECCDKI